MSLDTRDIRPDCALIEGGRIAIFIGSGYRYLSIEQAKLLHQKLGEAIAKASGSPE